jgi:hypothetical protein
MCFNHWVVFTFVVVVRLNEVCICVDGSDLHSYL